MPAKIPEDYLSKLAATYEPRVARAFLRWVKADKPEFDVADVARMMKAADIAAEIRMIVLEKFEGSTFAKALTGVTRAGAAATIPAVPKGAATATFTFGRANPFAVAASKNVAEKVVRALGIQRDIRYVVRRGIADGTGPIPVAREIRKFISLAPSQQKWVDSVDRRLRSGSPSDLRAYLGMKLRDRRFDGAVYSALKTGNPIPLDKRLKMVRRYYERTLKYRSEVIARTETLTALGEGQRAVWSKAIADGVVNQEMLEKKWIDGQDSRVRETHRDVMNGEWIRFEDDFVLSSAFYAAYPRDPKLPPEEFIQCRCTHIIRVNPKRKPVPPPEPVPPADVHPIVPTPPRRVLALYDPAKGGAVSLAKNIPLEQQERDVKRMFDSSDVYIRIRRGPFQRVIREGRLKNQHETGTSGGMLDPDFRLNIERNLWGAPATMQKRDLPVYGHLSNSGDPAGSMSARHYGGIALRLKKENVAPRTTVTYSDSLSRNYGLTEKDALSKLSDAALKAEVSSLPVPMNAPSAKVISRSIPDVSAREFASGNTRSIQSYLEAQIWGGVTLDDIAEIYYDSDEFSSGLSKAIDKDVLAIIKSKKIKITPFKE